MARPNPNGNNPPTATSPTANNVLYSAFTFTAPSSGRYDFLSTGTAPFNPDTFLYSGSFDPANPLGNIVIGNATITGGGAQVSAFGEVPLIGGNSYVYVTTGSTNAQVGTFSNTISFSASPAQTAIADSGANEVAGAPLARTLSVGAAGAITSFNSITLQGLSHDWLGDLTITLSHGGVTVDLIDRIGKTTAGTSSNGVSARFVDTNTYTFALTGASLSGIAGSAPLAGGTYAPFTNGTAGESSPFNGSLADFIGQDVGGDWTVTITDRDGTSTGAWRGIFSIDVSVAAATAVPEPGSLALALAAALPGAGLLLRAARRRRAGR
jgi:hypothetical protein